MKRLLSILALGMMTSCSAPNEYVLYWPSDNPPEDLPKLEEAVAHWNYCGVVQVSISKSEGIPITYVPGGDILDPSDPSGHYHGRALSVNYNCTGCVYSGTHVIYTHRAGYPSTDVDRSTIEHEIGHVMGLHHFGELNQELMYHDAGYGTKVGPEDCRQLRDVHGYGF
jgi:predicted Zn-dependent protease